MSNFASYSSRSGRSGNKKPSLFKRIEFRPLRNSSDDEEEVELLSRGSSSNSGGGLKRRSPTVVNSSESAFSSNSAFMSSTTSPGIASGATTKFFIEHKLQPDDTVLGLSLRYSCSVADLKRMNGLTADQDLFALKVVKIPVSPFGALKQASSSDAANDLEQLRPTSSSPTENPEGDSTRPERFFSKIDSSMQESFFWLAKKPLAPILDEQSSPEVVISTGHHEPPSHLPSTSLAFPKAALPKRPFSGSPNTMAVSSDEVACNNKWVICLIIFAFVFIFALVPIIYFVAMEEKVEEEKAHELLLKKQDLMEDQALQNQSNVAANGTS